MLNKITLDQFRENKEQDKAVLTKKDLDKIVRERKNQKKRDQNLYQTTIWVHESWRGDEALANMKRRLEKPRIKFWDLVSQGEKE